MATPRKSTEKAPKAEQAEGNEQFPSLDGEKTAEIAQRSQDETKATASVHHKDYVVLAEAWRNVEKTEAHRNNIEAARQALISQGLRPTGDGKYLGSAEHPDRKSLILSYEIPVTTAVLADPTEEPLVAGAHVTLDDQHAAEKASE